MKHTTEIEYMSNSPYPAYNQQHGAIRGEYQRHDALSNENIKEITKKLTDSTFHPVPNTNSIGS